MFFFFFIFKLLNFIFQLILLILQPFYFPSSHLKTIIFNIFSPPPVFAATHQPDPIFADDFSSGLTKWKQVAGLPKHWQISADGWLDVRINTPQTITVLVPQDQVWQQSWRNYQLEFDFEIFSSADINFNWGFTDMSNWYEIHFYNGFFYLIRVKNGQLIFSHTGEYDLPINSQHRVTIIFNYGRIQVMIDNDLVVSRLDSSYEANSGKIALRVTTGAAYPTHVRFDNLAVYLFTDSVDQVLSLTKFSQHVLPWSNDEYDQALSWPSWGDWQAREPLVVPKRVRISHWGCALSSLAMILDYYDLNLIPAVDASSNFLAVPLNPGTLNEWLKQQADGYLGEGSINWLAGSRLSKKISDEFSTALNPLPKLEYHRNYSADQQFVKDMISHNRPAILQIPGHFLVAHGYAQADDDFYITDPAYKYDKLSQHEQSLLSVIDYQPSQTDLSYLMLVYDAKLKLDLLDADMQIIDQGFFAQDTVAQPEYDHEQCLLESEYPSDCFSTHATPMVQYFSKLATADYYLRVSLQDAVELSSLSLPLHWQIFVYDTAGEVKMMDRYFFADEELLQLQVNQQDLTLVSAQSLLVPDLAEFAQSLATLADFTQLSPYLYFRLQEIATWSMAVSSSEQKDRYQQLILALLTAFSAQITPSAKNQLFLSLL